MVNNIINPSGAPSRSEITRPAQINCKETKETFDQLVQTKIDRLEGGVKLSSHVRRRLEERKINLDAELAGKISAAFQKAETKGAKDSLLLINDLALIASISNKTIVTALDETGSKDRVFTNIDSAVIIK